MQRTLHRTISALATAGLLLFPAIALGAPPQFDVTPAPPPSWLVPRPGEPTFGRIYSPLHFRLGPDLSVSFDGRDAAPPSLERELGLGIQPFSLDGPFSMRYPVITALRY